MTSPGTSGPIDGPGQPRRPGNDAALATIAAGTFLALVVFTLPLADLPTLARALGAGPAAQAWILSSMSVGLAASMLPVGALADDHGRRRVFVAGAVIMVAGSVGCALASVPAVFVAGRIVQGIGGSALIAAGLALISALSPDVDWRSRATAVWGTSLGAGIACGPLLAGALDPFGLWRLVYLLVGVAAVVLFAVAVAQARRGVLSESVADVPRATDLPGALTFGAAMSLILVGLTEVRQPTGRVTAVVAFVIALVLAVVFAAVERRRRHPMIALGSLREPHFAATSLAGLITGGGVIALMSITCSYLIADLGLAPLAAAGMLVLWSGTSALTAIGSRRLRGVAAGPAQLAAGLIGVAIGQFALYGADRPARMVPGLLLAGISSGVLNAALGREAVASAPEGRAGIGSGMNNTARYLGSAIGVTITSILVLGAGRGLAAVPGWNRAVLVTGIVSLLGGVLVALLLRRRRAASAH